MVRNCKYYLCRFSEVDHINNVAWLEIHGRTQTKTLSPNTTYAASLVPRQEAFEYPLMRVSVRIVGEVVENEVEEVANDAYLVPDMFTATEGVYLMSGWRSEMGSFLLAKMMLRLR